MKTITIAAIVLLTSIASVGGAQTSVVGRYQSNELSIVDKGVYFLKGVKYFAQGVTLSVNADSTFSYQTCRSQGSRKGRWAVQNKVLILKGDSERDRGQLHQNGTPQSQHYIKYAIKYKQLSMVTSIQTRNSTGRVAFLLTKM
jgi:hypothetical protein